MTGVSAADPAVCELLAWDSDFFGFPVARVQGDTLTPARGAAIAAFCRERRIRCLYFLARTDDPPTLRLAADLGFRLVDIRLTLVCQLETRQPCHPAAHAVIPIRPATAADLPALRRIARHSFQFSRFFADGRFPRPLCEALYDAWVTWSWAGRAAAILVADAGDGPAGFVTLRLDPQAGSTGAIELLGVAAPWHGRGVGAGLLKHALDWFQRARTERVVVVTQGRNIPAQCLYQRGGFVTRNVELWYHRWDDDSLLGNPATFGGERQR